MAWPVSGWTWASKAVEAGKAAATRAGIEPAPGEDPAAVVVGVQSPPQKMKS